jgi:hypothetical protein
MSTRLARSRATLEAYLADQKAAEQDENVGKLLSSMIENARARQRSDIMLGTLARLVEACNDIESGRAAALAQQADLETARLRAGVNKITFANVGAYVRVRRKLDRQPNSEWEGPTDVTVRSDRSYKAYVEARADRIQSKPRIRPTDRDRRLEEIIGDLSAAEDRNELRWALEEGRKARRRELLMQRAIKSLQPDFDLDEMLSQPSSGKRTKAAEPAASTADLQVLKRIVRRLTSDEELRPFGLAFTAGRLKMTAAPGSRLLEKDEIILLQRLAGLPHDGFPN